MSCRGPRIGAPHSWTLVVFPRRLHREAAARAGAPARRPGPAAAAAAPRRWRARLSSARSAMAAAWSRLGPRVEAPGRPGSRPCSARRCARWRARPPRRRSPRPRAAARVTPGPASACASTSSKQTRPAAFGVRSDRRPAAGPGRSSARRPAPSACWASSLISLAGSDVGELVLVAVVDGQLQAGRQRVPGAVVLGRLAQPRARRHEPRLGRRIQPRPRTVRRERRRIRLTAAPSDPPTFARTLTKGSDHHVGALAAGASKTLRSHSIRLGASDGAPST